MPKEKMAELIIKLPARWVNFIEDYYKVTGVNREKDMKGTIASNIQGFMIEDDRLSLKDRIRLVEKHKLTDIYEIPGWAREEVSNIKPEPEPIPKAIIKAGVSEGLASVLSEFLAREVWKFIKDAPPDMIERIKAMTSEELEKRINAPRPDYGH
jgi:hypothetical protein